MLTRSGPDVDHPVGRPDGLLVVLHDDQGVAQVAQPDEGRDELRVVLLVEADGRLVEDVQHAHQARPDLRRQSDALGLPTGQRGAGAVDGQVVQPDIDEETEAREDLLENLPGDGPLAVRQPVRETLRPSQRIGHGEARHVRDVAPLDGDGQRLRLEPLAPAGLAGTLHHELLELALDPLRLRLAVAPLEVRQQPLERRVVGAAAAVVLVADAHLVLARGVEQILEMVRRQVAHRHVRSEAACPRDALHHLAVPRVGDGHPRPGHDGALGDGEAAIGDQPVGVELEADAQAGTRRAGAVRRVEREAAGLQLVDGGPVDGTREALAEALLLEGARVGRRDHDHAFPQAEGCLHRVGQARCIRVRVVGPVRTPIVIRVAHDDPIDDDLDGVALVAVQRGRLVQVVQVPIDADAHEALAACRLEDSVALRLAVLDEGTEDEQPRAVREAQDAVHDLLHRLALDLVAERAMRVTDPREQQAQMVVDLGDRAHGRTRVAAGALLVDGDGRAQPVDLIDVRLLHLPQELARVGREALHVAPLALGVDGVEGEAGLAAAGQPGDDHEAVTWQLDRDVLEVVFARAANHELLGHVGAGHLASIERLVGLMA